jgi:NAD(P)-dependent dehydrogenase (short-subunit alcohol dehydrogenase family)
MPTKKTTARKVRPAQSQSRQPGIESKMRPRPRSEPSHAKGSSRLEGKVALITGGDSGIGRAVALAFAREGADVAIACLDEIGDALETETRIKKMGRRCVLLAGDIGETRICEEHVTTVVRDLKRLDILVNNAAEQHTKESLADIDDEQLERTFRTNIFSFFRLTRAALPHLKEGAAIINTTSVTAYRGSPALLDYSSTKAAIVGFTRSLALSLVEKGIRVNAVAPGPVWTPLIPATFPRDKVATFGSDVPMKRAGEPNEIAEAYVFLASRDSTYMTGQVLHPNGGEIING